MKTANRLIGWGMILGLLLVPSALADDDHKACNGRVLKADFTAIGTSGIHGEATLCIGEEGVRGRIMADDLTAGNAYTVWFFYNAAPPGRFDSRVPDDDDATFSGHVGGLHPASGAKITLLMFDHGPNSGDPNVQAVNLLTPTGGHPAAKAVFDIP